MTTAFYLPVTALIAAAVALFVIGYRHRERRVRVSQWHAVDLQAMTRLFSEEDDNFLAAQLPFMVLVRLRLQRAIVACAYLSRLNENAARAIALATLHPDRDSAQLKQDALRLRSEVLRLYVKAWRGLFFPVASDLSQLAQVNGSLSRQFKMATAH